MRSVRVLKAHSVHRHSPRRKPPPFRAALPASALALVAVAGCTRTVTVTNTSDRPGTPTPSLTASPPTSNAALQVVNGSAAQNGQTGNGGTALGPAAQVRPPAWVQLSAVDSPQLGTHLIDVNQSTLYRFDEDTVEPLDTE